MERVNELGHHMLARGAICIAPGTHIVTRFVAAWGHTRGPRIVAWHVLLYTLCRSRFTFLPPPFVPHGWPRYRDKPALRGGYRNTRKKVERVSCRHLFAAFSGEKKKERKRSDKGGGMRERVRKAEDSSRITGKRWNGHATNADKQKRGSEAVCLGSIISRGNSRTKLRVQFNRYDCTEMSRVY